MRRRSLYLSLLLVIVFVTVSCSSLKSNSTAALTPNPDGAASPTSTTSLDGPTLVEERCSVCHPASIVSQRSHTSAQWKAIVNMMIQRGAQLSPAEETVVLGYLDKNFGQ